ncbi:uncharacterized protein PV09_04593 [Verruconis gallopava]|uniref:Major facilitator superfamily (MFS) profile domain-containing protein n=1 Tax=Verruconis gallopava TaxID=253628 RepID=A0A0D1YUD9_9PEZI|nr:uncharacterized protein PV09_04593 [Verruconis gallopava]KIW04297.1 hypothetical protein PV09_04593 [Verruconis gallopava]
MAWGVLDDKRTPFPYGTIILDRVDLVEQQQQNPGSKGTSKEAISTVLHPQPSTSPNDPLNWSLTVKASLLMTLIVTVTAIGGIHGMLGTAGRILAEEYDVSYANLVRTLQAPSIAAGAIALFFWSAVGAIWGKRLPIMVAVIVIWITMFIGYFANSLAFYRALSVASSVFGSAPELLIAPVITDLSFVHQRGKIMAIVSVVTLIGMDSTTVISGNIIENLGVKYLYIVSFGVMGVLLFMNLFLLRETTFHRGRSETNLIRSCDRVYDSAVKNPLVWGKVGSDFYTPKEHLHGQVPESPAAEPKRPWTWYLRVYYGRASSGSFIKTFFQPFSLLIFPSVLFSAMMNGVILTCSLISGVISAQVLLYPPYDIEPNKLAYLSLPASGAAFIASVVSGYLSDWMIRWMSKRNGGVYEPEFRLLMLIPAVILSTSGFLILGPMYKRYAPVWQIVLANLLFSVGMPFGTSACTTYILDTMQKRSSEAFVAATLFKSLHGFLATYYVPGWFANNGANATYRSLAILNMAFAALAIPVYCLGKRWRGVVSRNTFLRKHFDQDL